MVDMRHTFLSAPFRGRLLHHVNYLAHYNAGFESHCVFSKDNVEDDKEDMMYNFFVKNEKKDGIDGKIKVKN